MKISLLVILLTIFFQTVQSQDSTFFITDKKEVIWKKVYNTDYSYKMLLFELKKSGLFQNIDTINTTILGEIKRTAIDYSNAKETIWKSDIPLYVKMSDISATFEINFKPNKYQVIIKNIKCIGKIDNPTDNFLFSKPNEIESINFYALKQSKLEFNKPFIKLSIPIFNYHFDKLFSISNSKQLEW